MTDLFWNLCSPNDMNVFCYCFHSLTNNCGSWMFFRILWCINKQRTFVSSYLIVMWKQKVSECLIGSWISTFDNKLIKNHSRLHILELRRTDHLSITGTKRRKKKHSLYCLSHYWRTECLIATPIKCCYPFYLCKFSSRIFIYIENCIANSQQI